MNDCRMLEVKKLCRAYPNGDRSLTVLSEVSFGVNGGETCAILGPSGSGKTTLLGLCAGLDAPTSGTVKLGGQPLEGLDEDGRARIRNELVGFVFQNFQLIPTLTALENVMVPMELRGRDKAKGFNANRESSDLLQRVGLGDRLDHYPVQLSGGEQQRVALARAFINRPKVLFADEPTGNLDSDTSGKIVDLLFGMNSEWGTTLVLVTHDLDLAARTNRILRLKGGVLVSDERVRTLAGTPDQSSGGPTV